MVNHQIVFLVIISVVALQRLLEIRKSKRHQKLLLTQGGKEHAPNHYKMMVFMHTAWFGAMISEVFYFQRPFNLTQFKIAFVVMLMGNWLRFESMRTLGNRWTVRILTLPNTTPISTGIYRYVRHPIYLGVALELAAIPLLQGAYLTSIIFTILNLALMAIRIPAEQRALSSC
jgi:methyltransferase